MAEQGIKAPGSIACDVQSGHVIFDYDAGRELAGALALDMKISPLAMV